MGDFDRHKFTSSMPPIIRVPVRLKPVGGAIAPGEDISRVQLEDAFLMVQQWFTTSKRIHGILHYESPTQLFFLGYECNACHEIFLVPDSVKDDADLMEAMRHSCMEER